MKDACSERPCKIMTRTLMQLKVPQKITFNRDYFPSGGNNKSKSNEGALLWVSMQNPDFYFNTESIKPVPVALQSKGIVLKTLTFDFK